MQDQTVLITGSSNGFGLLTAVELAKRGFTVIASMRDLDRSADLRRLSKKYHIGDRMIYIQLDVASQTSVSNFTDRLRDLPPIDILVNNAGFALGGFCEETSLIEYKEQFETNFFGAVSVTQAVLPYMRERKRGKIINMSSISGKMGFPGLSPYVASKYALEGWTECLRLEVKPFGIDVALIEPGSYKTSIWSTGKKIAANSTLGSSSYSPYLKAIENQLEKGKSKYGDPRDVALLIADLCMQTELQALRNPIGRGVKTALNLKNIIPWKLWEKAFFHKLKIKK